MLLILLDGWEGCTWVDGVRWVRILLDGKEGSTEVQMARIVARALELPKSATDTPRCLGGVHVGQMM